MKAKINIFAPEDCSFRINVSNEPDDELRLRDQLYALAPNVDVISVTPSHQGSFDVVIEGLPLAISALCSEYDVPEEDIDLL